MPHLPLPYLGTGSWPLHVVSWHQAMTMMFEVQDLAVASPATVSRCGMVYLEPSILGLLPFVECWLKNLPAIIKPYEETFRNLFVKFLEVSEATGMPANRVGKHCHHQPREPGVHSQQSSISFIRVTVKEVIASTNSNLTMSLLKLLDCFFRPFLPREVQPKQWRWRPALSCPQFSLPGLQRAHQSHLPLSGKSWIHSHKS